MKVFKKFLLALAVFSLCLGLSACGDDDKNLDKPEDIAGTWLCVKEKGWSKENDEIVDEWEEDYPDGLSLRLSTDGTFMYLEDGEETIDYGTYTFADGVYTEKLYYGEPETYKVTKLTKTTLVMESTYKLNSISEKYRCLSYTRIK